MDHTDNIPGSVDQRSLWTVYWFYM